MAFTPKDWKDSPDHSTPITAAALEDLETRVSGYTDTVAGTAVFEGTVDSVTQMGLVVPSGNDINGYVVKSPSSSWGASSAYGNAQAFMLLREDYAGAPNGGANIEPDKNVLFRVNGADGGIGTGGGIHSAAGLRQRAGYTATQNVWIQNFLDTVGLAITAYSSQTTDLIFVGESDSGALFRIAANGQVQTSSIDSSTSAGLSLGRNNSTEGQILILASDLDSVMPGSVGDQVYHLNTATAARGHIFSTGALDGSAVALLSISQSGVFVGVDMDMAGHKIVDGAAGTATTDFVIKSQIDTLVTGPSSATSANLPSFNGTTGKIVQDSGAAAANVPATGEKAALVGTSGTPGSGNKYVTDGDSRNTNARTPSAHHTTHSKGGSDAVALGDIATAIGDVPTALIDAILPWLVTIDPKTLCQAAATGTWLLNSVGAVGNVEGYISQTTPAQNNEISYDVTLAAGTYEIDYTYFKTNASGINTVTLDGVAAGTVDQYAASNTFLQTAKLTGVVISGTGVKRLKFKMATKNASSSNYDLAVHSIAIRRTA